MSAIMRRLKNSTRFLESIISPHPPPFALLHRPATNGPKRIEAILGDVTTPGRLAELQVGGISGNTVSSAHGLLALIPYRQIAERGFDCVNDFEPLIALRINASKLLPLGDVVRKLPDEKIDVRDEHYDLDDDAYAELADRIIQDEIGAGAGANFVLKRSYIANIPGFEINKALSLFRRLISHEAGTYWTFIVHTGDRTFVGATPERHMSLSNGVATMNPISGTFRYPPSGPTLDGVLSFLNDNKETEELYMVVDEELKMMARICESGGTVHGPYLRSMTRLAHTEYFIKGKCHLPPSEILRETLFAPTIMGSPLENACRIIKKYEPRGRGYYGGVIALIGRDKQGGHALDSSILIRTADITKDGAIRIGVGSTLVRQSDPISEAAETKAKAAGLLAALQGGGSDPAGSSRSRSGEGRADSATPLEAHPAVCGALQQRNRSISPFWLAEADARKCPRFKLLGLRTLIVDAEDTFTSMIRHQLQSLGLSVLVRRFDEPLDLENFDLVVMGPGPGDPVDRNDPRIIALDDTMDRLLAERRRFLAVCLSHQIFCRKLGFDLVRRARPNQGTQQTIDLFGEMELVGFYNSYCALAHEDRAEIPGVGPIQVSRNAETGEVFALRGCFFSTFQFHAESVLTEKGEAIFENHLQYIIANSEDAPFQPHEELLASSA